MSEIEAPNKEAIAAFIKAQQAMENAKANAENGHLKNKYADLASVRAVTFPALHDHGFAVQQVVVNDGDHEALETRFLHETGEVFSTSVRLVYSKNDMQARGSAITYARRYGLAMLAGVASEDDDGNAASGRGQQAGRSATQPINGSQKIQLEKLIDETGTDINAFLQHYRAPTMDRFPAVSFRDAMARLKKKAAQMNGTTSDEGSPQTDGTDEFAAMMEEAIEE